MMVQILVRALGRCEQFDVEAVEQRARSKGGAGEAFVDAIIMMIGGFPIERDVEAEDVGKDMVQPHPRRGAAEQMEIGREQPPRRSEEHTSELQSLMRISYAVFCLQK